MYKYKVKVSHLEPFSTFSEYAVIAATQLEAKTKAFCLNNGFSFGLDGLTARGRELVRKHTSILEVSSA